MVLFKDEEQRYKKPPSRARVITGRIIKVTLVLALLLWLSLTVLRMLGGQHEALKTGIEEYIGGVTGTQVEIGTFHYLNFFPDMAFYAEDITLTRQGRRAGHIEKAHVSMPFWDMVLRRGRIEILELTGAQFRPGLFTQQSLTLTQAAIGPDNGTGSPGLRIEGLYGGQDLAIRLQMELVSLRGGRTLYQMPAERHLEAALGQAHLQADITLQRDGLAVHMTALRLPELPADKILDGTLLFGKGLFRPDISADLRAGRSRVALELRRDEHEITGSVHFAPLDLADRDVLAALYRFYRDQWPHMARHGAEEEPDRFLPLRRQLALDLRIEFLQQDGQALGRDIQTALRAGPEGWQAGPLQGNLAGGTVEGRLGAQAGETALRLIARAIDYNTARIVFADRDGQGPDLTGDLLADLSGADYKALAGEIILISRGGQLAGLLPDAPDRGLDVSCLFGFFPVEQGRATPAPLLIKTAQGAFRGSGAIDLAAPDYDDLTISARDLDAPPEPAPVFWRFTRADAGLGPDHPCFEIFGGSK